MTSEQLHDGSDEAIGAYLAGELSPAEVADLERHLLTCDGCWVEVDAGRRGRALVQQVREPVPDDLRARVMAAVAAEQREGVAAEIPVAPQASPSQRARPQRARPQRAGRASWWRRPAIRLLTPVLAGAVAAGIVVGVAVVRGLDDDMPAAVVAAVEGYQGERLPGSRVPDSGAPDLSMLKMDPMGAGTGMLGDQMVTGYAYEDTMGRRLVVYYSKEPFQMPQTSDEEPPPGYELMTTSSVTVFCSRAPHTVLVLGEDHDLVMQAAGELDLV